MGKGGFTAKLKKKLSLGGVTLFGAALFVFLIVFDLATKALAEKYLADGRAVKIVGDFVVLRLVYNRGISFGMFSDSSVGGKIAIIVLTALMMIALSVFYALLDKRRKTLRISLIFVVAGGIGNLIDRIVFKMWQTGGAKGVRDMVDVSGIKFGSFNFGVCNFAVLSFLFFDSEALFPTKKSKALAETLAAERGGNEKAEANDKTDGGADEGDKTGEEGGGQ